MPKGVIPLVSLFCACGCGETFVVPRGNKHKRFVSKIHASRYNARLPRGNKRRQSAVVGKGNAARAAGVDVI